MASIRCIKRPILTRGRLIGRTTEVGSRTLVEAAKAGVETHGIYMTDCKVGEVSGWVRSQDGVQAQAKIYSELISILDSIEPGVSSNI
jgi:retinol dehydrogenase-12